MRHHWLWIFAMFVALARPDCALAGDAAADSTPRIPERDRIRLAEAFRLAESVQDHLWPQWSSAPFALLLVTPEVEFLVRHPAPGPEFAACGFDSLLRSAVYWRKRVFPVTFQATFPAVGGISTIVIGQAESAQPPQGSSRWVLTVMHEHFHQWQESRPGYMKDVEALDLARGDSTGMWMLNFPFPYADSSIARAFDELCRLRAVALRALGTKEFAAARRACEAARGRLTRLLAPDDARYLDFQLWKEGVARYTEYEVARLAGADYKPSARFAGLDDYTPFALESRNVRERILDQQSSMQLSSSNRIAVYSSGAADALLLDAIRPDWKRRYTSARFSLNRLFRARALDR